MLETLVSTNATIHSLAKQQANSILHQTMKDIHRLEKNAKNHKKEIKKLKKKELERYQKRDSLEGEEITALKKVANVPLNDELLRKVAKKELRKKQNLKRAIVEYFSSSNSGSENEKPRSKKQKKEGKETAGK